MNIDLYRRLSKVGFLKKSYVFKFFFVAFIGIHIPLIGLLFFILFGNITFSTTTILVFTLVMTLMATAFTLLVLRKLVVPIELASKTLHDYKTDRTLSQLPTNFNDEAGLLMQDIHELILDSENFINEKKDLIYLLSHDLKNFAGNPQALAKLILEADPPEEIREFAEMIHHSTSQQFKYLEKFLMLLKEQDEAIKSNLLPKRIEFQSVFLAVEDQVRQLMTIKNILLLTSIEVKEADLRIDKELLIRVMVNLIDNAIKFSFPDSEIQLRIYSKNKELYITVSDNGMGFDPAYSEQLFDKFTKMSKLGTSKEASTGIGLYLCKKIVEKNQGKLTAFSEGDNKGATFSIVFA